MLNQNLNQYRILEVLGTGGMGVVYRAHDSRLQRDVAIKVIRSEVITPKLRSAFLREARLASSLNHPSIITIFDIVPYGDSECIVMEYLPGKPLSEMIPPDGFPLDTFFPLAFQIADGLAAAHSAGVVHRDLKPGNILVRANGLIKILDFGVAKSAVDPNLIGGTQSASLFSNSVVGTIAYMAPEQARGECVDARADIFSLGVMFSQMLTGRLPFQASNPVSLLSEIQNRPPLPPTLFNNDLPPAFDRLICRALEKDADARFQSVAEMVRCLRQLAAGDSLAELGSCATDGETVVRPLPNLGSISASRSQPTTSYTRPPRTGMEQASVTVMPFASLSPDPEDEYLASGMAQEIIGALTGVPALRIAPQLASFRLHQERRTDPLTVARLLNTGYVLTGTIRRSEDQVRVSAELVDAMTDTVVWSRSYDRRFTGIFEVQEDIAKRLVGSLGGHLIRSATDLAFHSHADNLNAWGLVRKAYYIWNYEFRVEGVMQSIALLRRAVSLDSAYAIGRAYLGLYLIQSVIHSISPDPVADRTEALASADLACSLAPNDPEALENASIVWIHSAQYRKAVHHLKRAIRIAPFDLVAWGYLGFAHACAGGLTQVEEAHRILKRLLADAPDHPSVPYWCQFLTIACLRLSYFDQAVESGQMAVESQPGFVFNEILLAESLVRAGRCEESRAVLDTIPGYNPQFTLAAFQEVALQTCGSQEIVDQLCGSLRDWVTPVSAQAAAAAALSR